MKRLARSASTPYSRAMFSRSPCWTRSRPRTTSSAMARSASSKDRGLSSSLIRKMIAVEPAWKIKLFELDAATVTVPAPDGAEFNDLQGLAEGERHLTWTAGPEAFFMVSRRGPGLHARRAAGRPGLRRARPARRCRPRAAIAYRETKQPAAADRRGSRAACPSRPFGSAQRPRVRPGRPRAAPDRLPGAGGRARGAAHAAGPDARRRQGPLPRCLSARTSSEPAAARAGGRDAGGRAGPAHPRPPAERRQPRRRRDAAAPGAARRAARGRGTQAAAEAEAAASIGELLRDSTATCSEALSSASRTPRR